MILATIFIMLSYKEKVSQHTLPAIREFPPDTKCDSRVVVSFTTIPARLAYVPEVITRLATQIYRPDAIYACIPYTSRRTGEPYHIPTTWQFDDPRIRVVRCDDFGPATKLLGCVEHECAPDTIIITIDDDHRYTDDTILKRVVYSMKYPDACISCQALMRLNKDATCHISAYNVVSPYVQFLEGFGCVSYRRKFIVDDMLNYYRNSLSYECLLSDDITISTWFRMNNATLLRLCDGSGGKTVNKVDIIQPLHTLDRLRVYRKCNLEMDILQFARKFVWAKSFYRLADKYQLDIAGTCPKFDQLQFQDIHDGDIVTISTGHLTAFMRTIFKHLRARIILITTDSDLAVPTDISDIFSLLINDDRLIHWFSTNVDISNASPKLTSIPLGLDYHTRYHRDNDHPYSQERELQRINSELPPLASRETRAYVNFQFNRATSKYEDRGALFRRLEHNPAVYCESVRTSQYDFWRAVGKYAFVVSPHGVGLDCHRTWEALILGAIVIVKTSPLDVLYKDLPVIIVSDWNEITVENLTRWKRQILGARFNYEKLTMSYWEKLIKLKRLDVSRVLQ